MLFMNIKDRKKLINREIFEKENNDIEKARSFCKEVQKLGKNIIYHTFLLQKVLVVLVITVILL